MTEQKPISAEGDIDTIRWRVVHRNTPHSQPWIEEFRLDDGAEERADAQLAACRSHGEFLCCKEWTDDGGLSWSTP